MAKFTLDLAHVKALLDPPSATPPDWVPFVSGIDPDVRWFIASEKKDPARKTGVYNLASWTEEVAKPLAAVLAGPLRMTTTSIDIVGNKAITEAYGEATQVNGRPYNNRYAWFLVFSEETGKVVEIREYCDTALLQEIGETNPTPPSK
ncbi:hypothetical protein B0H14DRAFT_2387400 [Mycena olivaceomarginata]|nr:hypothetical protein B0H14DRAFT_2387400 [Mycena olivaceomarginata]